MNNDMWLKRNLKKLYAADQYNTEKETILKICNALDNKQKDQITLDYIRRVKLVIEDSIQSYDYMMQYYFEKKTDVIQLKTAATILCYEMQQLQNMKSWIETDVKDQQMRPFNASRFIEVKHYYYAKNHIEEQYDVLLMMMQFECLKQGTDDLEVQRKSFTETVSRFLIVYHGSQIEKGIEVLCHFFFRTKANTEYDADMEHMEQILFFDTQEPTILAVKKAYIEDHSLMKTKYFHFFNEIEQKLQEKNTDKQLFTFEWFELDKIWEKILKQENIYEFTSKFFYQEEKFDKERNGGEAYLLEALFHIPIALVDLPTTRDAVLEEISSSIRNYLKNDEIQLSPYQVVLRILDDMLESKKYTLYHLLPHDIFEEDIEDVLYYINKSKKALKHLQVHRLEELLMYGISPKSTGIGFSSNDIQKRRIMDITLVQEFLENKSPNIVKAMYEGCISDTDANIISRSIKQNKRE